MFDGAFWSVNRDRWAVCPVLLSMLVPCFFGGVARSANIRYEPARQFDVVVRLASILRTKRYRRSSGLCRPGRRYDVVARSGTILRFRASHFCNSLCAPVRLPGGVARFCCAIPQILGHTCHNIQQHCGVCRCCFERWGVHQRYGSCYFTIGSIGAPSKYHRSDSTLPHSSYLMTAGPSNRCFSPSCHHSSVSRVLLGR